MKEKRDRPFLNSWLFQQSPTFLSSHFKNPMFAWRRNRTLTITWSYCDEDSSSRLLVTAADVWHVYIPC